MRGIPYLDVDYCQYSNWGYRKPTRIWGSPEIAKLDGKTCDWETCQNLVSMPNGGKRHKYRLGGIGQKINVRERGRMPPALVDLLVSAGGMVNRLAGFK